MEVVGVGGHFAACKTVNVATADATPVSTNDIADRARLRMGATLRGIEYSDNSSPIRVKAREVTMSAELTAANAPTMREATSTTCMSPSL